MQFLVVSFFLFINVINLWTEIVSFPFSISIIGRCIGTIGSHLIAFAQFFKTNLLSYFVLQYCNFLVFVALHYVMNDTVINIFIAKSSKQICTLAL